MYTRAHLQVKLEGAAEIRGANPGRRDPGADIKKRNPPGPDRKVVSQMMRKSDQPIRFRRVLAAPK